MNRSVTSLLGVIALVVLWLAFAPPVLGGSTNYVIVDGKSMQPTYYTGDLVVLRKQASYQVGDAVAFVIPANGSFVIHRIIEVRGDRYVLQGDNNDFIDEYNPNDAEVLGKARFHVPGGGSAISQLSSPSGFTIMFVLVGGLLFRLILRDPRRNRHRARTRRTHEEVPT